MANIPNLPALGMQDWEIQQAMGIPQDPARPNPYPHNTIIKPKNIINRLPMHGPFMQNDPRQAMLELPETNISARPPQPLIVEFMNNNFEGDDAIFAATLAMMALEHVHNRPVMPTILMLGDAFNNLGWLVRHTSWTNNFFALLSVVFAIRRDGLNGFLMTGYTSINNLHPALRVRAQKFAYYLSTSYPCIYPDDTEHLYLRVSYEEICKKNLRGWWDQLGKQFKLGGMFSQEFLYERVTNQERLQTAWGQGVPFPLVLHLDSLLFKLKDKYRGKNCYLCRAQRTMLTNNYKLYTQLNANRNQVVPRDEVF